MTGLNKTIEYLAKNAKGIRDDLAGFAESAAVFSSDKPRLIDRYENKWVGVYRGKVIADADTLEQVTQELSQLGVPAGDTMIRRIEREEKTLIL